jgi:hypothetical protein
VLAPIPYSSYLSDKPKEKDSRECANELGVVAALSGAASSVFVLISFLFLASQIREARKAAVGQAFLGIVAVVQDQSMREARRRVFALRDTDLNQWTEENISDVEKVCQSYDIFGILCRHRLVPTKMVIDSWRDSLTLAWSICEPYVASLRAQREAPEFWDDFEWLAKQAQKRGRRRIARTRDRLDPRPLSERHAA